MDVQAIRNMVQKVMVEELDLPELDSEGAHGEVQIAMSKVKSNGSRVVTVTIFSDDDEFYLRGSIDPALELASFDLYKKIGNRVLGVE
jgi:hypothetical protein